jgi:thiol:disulfide interchange protein DsbC
MELLMKQQRYAGRGLLVALLLSPLLVLAEPDSNTVIRQALTKIIPGAHDIRISPSPVPGLSEVLLGSNVYYATNDGKYILQGSLIELATRTDLTEERMKGVRLDVLGKVDEKDMIVFAAPEERHVITVFTDIDCGYCRKLHQEVGEFNKRGISVHYLAYPRSGPQAPSFQKAVSVWCSKDRNDALTRAKAGKEVTADACDSPVQAQFEIGQQVGVTGTPAILLEDGSLLPGYVPAERLAAELDKKSKS